MSPIKTMTAAAVILFLSINLYSQDTIQINFDAEYHSIEEDGLSFMKLIDNHDNTIQYDGNEYEVIFPDDFFVRDTAIGFNYFTGWENPLLDSSPAFLFGNYTSKLPIVYVDRNYNLDFSDDGQPLKFNQDSTLTVYLNNSKVPSAFFPIHFYYPTLDSKWKAKVEAMFASMGPDVAGNNIVGIEYWVADKRLNHKITNSWLNNKNIKIGLHDFDCNGLYNDKYDEDSDRILIGNFEENKISWKLEGGAIEYTEKVQIPLAGKIYEVLEIEQTGKYIKLVESSNTYVKPLGVGDYVGNIKIDLVSGDSILISDLQKENEYLILDFWGTWCRGCTQQLPQLQKLALDNPDKVKVIGLNYGDEFPSIDAYLTKHNIEWNNGIASNELIDLFRIDIYPTYVLIDPKGKITSLRASIQEIQEILGQE